MEKEAFTVCTTWSSWWSQVHSPEFQFKQTHKFVWGTKKLKEKNQTEQQQKQALHAISIYFDIEFPDKDKNIPLENKKRILSSKKGNISISSGVAPGFPRTREWRNRVSVRHDRINICHSRESGNPEKWHSRGFAPIYWEDTKKGELKTTNADWRPNRRLVLLFRGNRFWGFHFTI